MFISTPFLSSSKLSLYITAWFCIPSILTMFNCSLLSRLLTNSSQTGVIFWQCSHQGVVRLPDPWNWETIYYTSKQIYLHSDQDLVPRVRGGDCSQPAPEKVQGDISKPDHPRKLISWKLGSPGRPLSIHWCLDVLVYQEGCENQPSSWSTIF